MSRSSSPAPEALARGEPDDAGAPAVQPHGALLLLREPSLRVVQASTNAARLLRRPLDALLLCPLRDLGGDLESRLRALLQAGPLNEATVLRCHAGAAAMAFEAVVHRVGGDLLALELEPAAETPAAPLLAPLGRWVQALSTAPSVASLADQIAGAVQVLTGHRRVLVYELGAEGPGKVIAEVRDAALPPWLGEHVAALDLHPTLRPRRLVQRVQMLVDAAAEPCELLPEAQLGPEGALDLTAVALMAPAPGLRRDLQQLGAAAALSVALVREGALWGLIVGLSPQPLHVPQGVRAAADLLAEVAATRLAAIESHARAQVTAQVRQLEARLLEATSVEGDWRRALFEDPHALLRPLAASGMALWHDGQCTACGTVPAPLALDALQHWLDGRAPGQPWHCVSLAREAPLLAPQSPGACGVLAVRLSSAPGTHLAWLRTAHGAAGPGHLPTALPWTGADIALAAAFGHALVDLIVQVNAVRMLIAESQLSQLRATVAGAHEALVVVADATPRGFYGNDAFYALAGCRRDQVATLAAFTGLFDEPALAQGVMGQVRAEHRAWQGELRLRQPRGPGLPVAVRAEPVPGSDGRLLGLIVILEDLSTSKHIEAARRHLESALTRTGHALPRADASPDGQTLVGAIIANASLAAMDIADSGASPAAAPLLQEVEASTARATALLTRIRALDERSK